MRTPAGHAASSQFFVRGTDVGPEPAPYNSGEQTGGILFSNSNGVGRRGVKSQSRRGPAENKPTGLSLRE